MLRRIIRRLRRTRSHAVPPVAATKPPPPPVIEEEPDPLPEVEIDTEQLKRWLADDESFTLVDIREPHEIRQGHATAALLLRMNDIPQQLDALPDKGTRLIIYCAAGSRSYGVAHWLREQGWEDSWSLESGFYGVAEAGMDVTRPGDK